MKVTVVYGNARHGSTWNSVQLYLKELDKFESNEIKEFTLPKDMPHFCMGCFTCFLKGEQCCPHSQNVQPIASAIKEADIVVLASPVYGLDVTGGMKALIDHLCYMWLSHRPDPGMFHKVGVVFATTAGAGLSHTAKTMRSSLQFWGVKRIYASKKRVSALKWEDVSADHKEKVQRTAARIASKSARAVRNMHRLSSSLFIKFLFGAMRGMMQKNDWNETDRNHWESQGWLAGKKPF